MIMMMWTGSLCSWIYFKRNTLNLESSIITMHWTRLQNNFRPFNYFGYSKNTEGILLLVDLQAGIFPILHFTLVLLALLVPLALSLGCISRSS